MIMNKDENVMIKMFACSWEHNLRGDERPEARQIIYEKTSPSDFMSRDLAAKTAMYKKQPFESLAYIEHHTLVHSISSILSLP